MALKSQLLLLLVLTTALGGSGCNSLLGNDDHSLAGSRDAGPLLQGGSSPDAGEASATDDSGAAADGPPGDAAGEAGSPGGPVTPSGGGIVSVGRVGIGAPKGTLPDGSVASVTDDGFEFGETLCNGSICVTGAFTP